MVLPVLHCSGSLQGKLQNFDKAPNPEIVKCCHRALCTTLLTQMGSHRRDVAGLHWGGAAGGGEAMSPEGLGHVGGPPRPGMALPPWLPGAPVSNALLQGTKASWTLLCCLYYRSADQ